VWWDRTMSSRWRRT